MKRIPVGSIVRIRHRFYRRLGRCLLVKNVFGTATVMSDGGEVLCGEDELIRCRDQSPLDEPMRFRLPYGIWTTEEGRELLFNRDYKPIWERNGKESVEQADRSEWVKGIDGQSWFYGDHNPPWVDRKSLERCTAALGEFLNGEDVSAFFDDAMPNRKRTRGCGVREPNKND